MIDIRRILCPTDFSEFAKRALHHAIPLARWYESSLTAVHVLPTAVPVDGMFPYSLPPLAHEGVRTRVERELDEFVAPAREAGIAVETVLREGAVPATILDLARSLPADMLVMGTHGESGLERLVLGSVTETVLRKAPCPVLTTSREDRAFSGPAPFKRILCATDFSPAAEHALGYALSLAEEAQGALILVHVMPGPAVAATASGVPIDLGRVTSGLERDAREALRQAVPSEARVWCDAEEHVAFGRPADEIVRLAHEREAQAIVMGVHGRNALNLMLFGSTTHHVIRHAPCPVLTIPAPRTADERQVAADRLQTTAVHK
jgi:nucleotide-binding universal stress UspA family protein